MPTVRASRVRREERGVAQAKDLDWDGARVFLEIARLGSLRSAAAALNQSVNALRRKLDRLEHGLGTKLLTRHVDGVRLTAEGTRVLTATERMETAAFDALRGTAEDAQAHGEVNLAVTEGLGTFWIAPRLSQFQDGHPGIQVNLHCGMAKSDILRLEADVAIQLERPQAKDVKVVKLGRLHLMPFASPDYIARHGAPKTPAELASHRIMIMAAADQIPTPEEYFNRFGHVPVIGEIMLRINVSSAHYFAVVHGAGIGLLPTYACNLGAPIVPLDCGYRSDQDIWLTYHPDVTRISRVQVLIDWLRELFSPRTNPWFDDRFLHPDEFGGADDGKRGGSRPRRGG